MCMKITSWFKLMSLLLSSEAISQKIDWEAESYSFFDNTEFGNSRIQIPQTMAGTRLAPELGLGWDSVIEEALHDNGIFLVSAGIDLPRKIIFDKFNVNAGWVAGLERARSENSGWLKHNGWKIQFTMSNHLKPLLT